MKQNKLAGALCVSLGAMCAAATAQAQLLSGTGAAAAEQRVWVQFKETSAPAPKLSTDPKTLLDQVAAAVAQAHERMNANVRGVNARLAQHKFGQARQHYLFEGLGKAVLTLPSRAALEALRKDPSVASVENDPERTLLAETKPYGVDLTQAGATWDADGDGTVDAGAPTGEGIKVCVIDSGLKRTHEDLAGLSVTGTPRSSGPNWDLDDNGHGTHVAGTVAAVGNNGKGVVGVSPGKVALHIVKFLDKDGRAYSSDLVSAVKQCEANGAKVVNMSLGGTGSNGTEKSELQKASDRGLLLIAAAGNYGDKAMPGLLGLPGPVNPILYPASYPSVMSVAAVDANSQRPAFSEYNNEVDIAAPGVSVLSLGLATSDPVQVGNNTLPANVFPGSAPHTASAGWVNGGLCKASEAAFKNKIVLCQRGEINFGVKAENAQSGGALGVVIYNNLDGPFEGALNNASGTAITVKVPVASISKADGEAILAQMVGQVATVSGKKVANDSSYAVMTGTSMASPHVAGAAAVVWSARPSATAAQVRNALLVTAKDLEKPGRDDNTGYGLVQIKAAVAELKRAP
ncbi:S8 family serine peptidase [Lysobacter enzymogenes]|uniref:S8 family serine peptidase n=1 Tax=Lysobacter enzymogenes TaxID=69 RepID=UPI001A965D8D|nr:S8 family serine peptidase [Lysobacter enzymogenes]QQP97230.1 S8 family serine peptidase [Lysobacter enzymogenes]